MMNIFQRKMGLKKKFIFTHLIIALIGIGFLGLSLGSMYWLKDDALLLLNERLPMYQSIKTIQVGMQRSMAALRGWMAYKDPSFVRVRNEAWDKDIIPNLMVIAAMSKKYDEQEIRRANKSLIKILVDLRVLQWKVQDVVQTPGNFPIRVFMTRNMLPIGNRITGMTNTLLGYLKKETTERKKEVITSVAEFRGHFTQSVISMVDFVASNSQVQLRKTRQSLRKAKAALAEINSEQAFLSRQEKEIYHELQAQFAAYQENMTELVRSRLDDQFNLAANWFATKALPLAKQAEEKINKISNVQLASLERSVGRLHRILTIVPLTALGFILLFLIFSIWYAITNAKIMLQPIDSLLLATNKLAAGELNEDIKIMAEDEIGELTQSFNKMRIQRQYAEDKIRNIIDTAAEPIITMDAEGIIQSYNSATRVVSGYEEQELKESHLSKLVSGLDFKTGIRAEKKDEDVYLVTKLGDKIPISISINKIRLGDETLFASIIYDLRYERKQAAKLKTLNHQLELENKNKTVISELDDVLRGEGRLDVFAEKVLSFFNHQFDITISAFYKVDEEKEKIKPLALYGLGSDIAATPNPPWGEGLIAQCIKSKELISLHDLPKNYFKVATGLGAALPKHSLLIPLTFESTVYGVLELCSFHKLEVQTDPILEHVCETIAIYLNMLIAKRNLEKLFHTTENQRQFLQAQDEELRKKNEELASQTDALQKSQASLRQKVAYIERQKDEIRNKSKEIQKVSQYKSEFLANMSHELRTPLNSLLILAQTFLKNKTGNLSEEQLEDAKIIYDAGVDLLALINDVLDISKVEAGRLEVSFKPVFISSVVSHIESLFKPLADKKGIKFIVTYDPETSTEAFDSDELRLMQIIKNMLSNAIKFTEEGQVALDITKSKDKLLFKVSDTGIGIPKQKHAAVFDEFQQVDASTSRKYGGTGLGLSISKKLANLLGGDITLESELGKGSVFTLILPNNHPTETGLSDKNIQQDTSVIKDDRYNFDNSKQSILILDNDVNLCRTLATIAREHGFQVLIALNAQTGYEMAINYQPSDLILDLGLPDMHGKEVLKKLKQKDQLKHLAIHVITARDVDQNEYFKEGVRHFLKKPVTLEDMTQLLKSLSIKNQHSQKSTSKPIKASAKASPNQVVEAAQPTSTTPVDLAGRSILLVDDDIRNTFALSKSLKDEGVKVIIADNGELAIEKLQQNKDIELILMDMMMPVMDGYEAIKQIRQMEDYAAIPIIALTARATAADRKQCLATGANDYISKPVNVDNLLQQINKWLKSTEV